MAYYSKDKNGNPRKGRNVDDLLDKIADAKIEGGTISIGGDSITPITEHQDISGKANVGDSYTKQESDVQLANKQDVLVSGTNIKTINSQSILGSGNIEIQSGSTQVNSDWNATSGVAEILNKPTIPTVPTNVSAFNNDAGYLTDEDMGDYATKQELQGKQDTINDLGSIRSGASAGATAYQLPQAGIPESDLSQGVKDKMNEKEVFWATYGTTTAAEIDAAVAAGKLVLCVYNNRTYVGVSTGNAQYIGFFATGGGATHALSISRQNNSWSSSSDAYEKVNNRKATITGNESSTGYYPTTKAVADYVHQETAQWGVVSQTQTWTRASDQGYDYTMSDLQYGWIPKSFIDSWNTVGMSYGRFNENTGYFEMNDLIDISYDEAVIILQKYPLGLMAEGWRPNSTRYGNLPIFKARTSIPIAIITSVMPYLTHNQYIETEHFAISDDSYTTFISYGNVRLRRMMDIISQSSALTLTNFFSLEECYFKLKANISIPHSGRLSVASVLYMIENVAVTTAITITIHAVAYNRAIADSDIQAALQAHTNVTLASA